jgi:hypothetical protein
MFITPAAQVAEIGRLEVHGQSGQNVSHLNTDNLGVVPCTCNRRYEEGIGGRTTA